MPLPDWNSDGDLPAGVYPATIGEVLARFSARAGQRKYLTSQLSQIYQLARATGKLDRLILFGSYVTAKPEPNDIDIVLIMRDDFELYAFDGTTRTLFDHLLAASTLGASIFWIRPAMLLGGTLEEFIAHWQIKRNGMLRGIVEVRA